jgi:hypothetical protein
VPSKNQLGLLHQLNVQDVQVQEGLASPAQQILQVKNLLTFHNIHCQKLVTPNQCTESNNNLLERRLWLAPAEV